MFTLDKVVYAKRLSKTYSKNKFEKQRNLMQDILDRIRYKEVIRDNLHNDAVLGTDFKYFETTKTPEFDKYLSDFDVGNITEINELSVNCSIINLPVDSCKIIGRKNGSPVVAFDLKYFNQFSGNDLKRKLQSFPKEIRDAWSTYSKKNSVSSWKVLNNDNTITTKVNCSTSDPWGATNNC